MGRKKGWRELAPMHCLPSFLHQLPRVRHPFECLYSRVSSSPACILLLFLQGTNIKITFTGIRSGMLANAEEREIKIVFKLPFFFLHTCFACSVPGGGCLLDSSFSMQSLQAPSASQNSNNKERERERETRRTEVRQIGRR